MKLRSLFIGLFLMLGTMMGFAAGTNSSKAGISKMSKAYISLNTSAGKSSQALATTAKVKMGKLAVAGDVVVILSDGTIVVFMDDGITVVILPDGQTVVFLPNGMIIY